MGGPAGGEGLLDRPAAGDQLLVGSEEVRSAGRAGRRGRGHGATGSDVRARRPRSGGPVAATAGRRPSWTARARPADRTAVARSGRRRRARPVRSRHVASVRRSDPAAVGRTGDGGPARVAPRPVLRARRCPRPRSGPAGRRSSDERLGRLAIHRRPRPAADIGGRHVGRAAGSPFRGGRTDRGSGTGRSPALPGRTVRDARSGPGRHGGGTDPRGRRRHAGRWRPASSRPRARSPRPTRLPARLPGRLAARWTPAC